MESRSPSRASSPTNNRNPCPRMFLTNKEQLWKAKKIIWGPMLYVSQLTGQLIPFDRTQATAAKVVLHFVPAVFSTVLLLARTIYVGILMMRATPMSINWTYLNILFFMALHGFVSSLILMKFKFCNFMDQTARLLITATRDEITKTNCLCNARWIKTYAAFVSIMAGSSMYCADNYLLYDKFTTNLIMRGFSHNETESFRYSMFFNRVLLPLDFGIIIGGAFMSATCLCLYASANAVMAFEYEKFNQHLSELIKSHRIMEHEVIKEIEHQIMDFLRLANHITHNNAGLLSISFIGGLVMQVCAQFAMHAFWDYLDIGRATFLLWSLTSAVMLVISVLRPASLYMLSRDTMDMLYLDQGIWRECKDERVRETARDTIDRIEKIDYSNKTLAGVKGSAALFNIIMIIIPFFVVILSAYKHTPRF